MRICYVADTASIHTHRWVNYLADRGHEVHLISWTRMPGSRARIQTHLLTTLPPASSIASRYLSACLGIPQTRRLIHKIKPDIVDGHFVTVYGFLAACSGFHPLVVTAWGSDLLIQPEQRRLWRFTARYSLNRADAIVCRIPVDHAKRILAGLGVRSDKAIRRILLGVNTVEFALTHRDDGVKHSLGIGSSCPVVISTRSFRPVYDVETLVRAIPLVLAEVPHAAFVIAGTGEQQNSLTELADTLGVSARTHFTGWIPRDKLPEYLATADIYVSTSLSDGTSNSLLEAMASHLAPIVTDIPANRDWIGDGENGFLFPVRDHTALAARIIELLGDPQVKEAFGRRSREKVQHEAEEQTQMANLEALYRELVVGQPHTR